MFIPKTHIYYLTASMGQESRHGFVGVSASGSLMRLQWRCWPRASHETVIKVLARITITLQFKESKIHSQAHPVMLTGSSFLPSVGLRASIEGLNSSLAASWRPPLFPGQVVFPIGASTCEQPERECQQNGHTDL